MKRHIRTAVAVILASLSVFTFASCGEKKSKADDDPIYFSSIEELEGEHVGVATDATCVEEVIEKIPDVQLDYYDTNSDMLSALKSGKLSAFVTDEPIAEMMIAENPGLGIIGRLNDDTYGFIFPKGKDDLCKQMNGFLEKLRSDGTLDDVKAYWTDGGIEHERIDMSGISSENGTLSFCTASETGAPFAYIIDGGYYGYDIDIAVRFCREYGYGLTITDTNFNGLLTGVANGKYDFGASCISITDERKNTLLMSEPSYKGGISVVAVTEEIDLSGKKVGVLTGSLFDMVTEEYYPDAELCYYDSNSFTAAALDAGKIDAYCCDEPVARKLISKYDNQKIVKNLHPESYGFVLPLGNERSQKLCAEFNEYLARIKADGTINELDEKWFGNDEEAQTIDFDALTGENGKISLYVNSDAGEPFDYYKNGHYVGYDVDIIYGFCLEKGYLLNVTGVAGSGILPAAVSGKADITASCFTITEERKKAMMFTDPYYDGGSVIVMKDSVAVSEKKSFFDTVSDNFKNTFIVEERWRLYVSGLGTTLLITVFSAVFGTLVGFAAYLLYRKKLRTVNAVLDGIMSILGRMPVVVILMVLFYVIFGSVDISGVIVSVIAFTVLFASVVTGLLKTSVSAVDVGQTEAALALGYTPIQTFFRIILPQALKYFLPGYNDAIVSLIKDTAIVGYISVQDLTKVSDIVRSRTFEAFFSILSTAIIYFAAASLLVFVINLIGKKTNNRLRSREKILSGVKTK